MSYSDGAVLRADVFWDEDNLSLSLSRYEDASQFILGFKDFDPACVQSAMLQAYGAVGKFAEDLKQTYDCRYVIPVPSHSAGHISPASDHLCQFLAKFFPWLQYPQGLLFRRYTVPAAHLRWERLSPEEHLDSLAWGGGDLAGAGVLLFDDVKTTGNTSLGCKWRLQKDAHCGAVVRLFLGRKSP